MSTTGVAQDRDALYYPYIHIRDVNWLKATLLCFPQVKRIVPENYPMREARAAQLEPFRKVKGPRGEPLLGEAGIYTRQVYQAQAQLRKRLATVPDLHARFARSVTQKRYGDQYEQFQIHKGKMPELLGFLREGDDPLAWHCRSSDPGQGWYALHPRLGKAVMSSLALTIANAEGLDIVTDSRSAHNAVVASNQDEVLEELLGGSLRSRPTGIQEKTEDLAQVLMTTCFDFSKLEAKHIAELLKEGHDLREFKDKILALAATIPDMEDPSAYRKRLEQEAQSIVSAWEKRKKSFPDAIRQLLGETLHVGAPGALVATAGVAATNPWLLAAGGGLVLLYASFQGSKIAKTYQENTQGPYPYLSRIHKAGATLITPIRG